MMRFPRWAGIVVAAVIGLLIGILSLVALGGREAPEWQAKLLLWGLPIVSVLIYLQRRKRGMP